MDNTEKPANGRNITETDSRELTDLPEPADTVTETDAKDVVGGVAGTWTFSKGWPTA